MFKIFLMQTEIGLISRDMDKFRDRLTEAEWRVGDTEDSVRDHHASLHTLRVKVHWNPRAEDSENRNRRNNLGLPEGIEGQDPAAYIEHLLCMLLSGAIFCTICGQESPQDATCARPSWCSTVHLYIPPAEFLVPGSSAAVGEEARGAAPQECQAYDLPGLLGGNTASLQNI